MPSSLTTPVCAQRSGRLELLTALGAVPGLLPRSDQSAGTLAGWGADRTERPSESAIHRLLTRVDADLLDTMIGAWMWTRTEQERPLLTPGWGEA